LGPDVSAGIKQGKVAHALEEVGLRDKADRYVGGELPGGLLLRGLSGGEKRRLSLVRPPRGLSALLMYIDL
jgi:ATP-binding cassette subfamily G (WHITE) protein 2